MTDVEGAWDNPVVHIPRQPVCARRGCKRADTERIQEVRGITDKQLKR